MKYIFLFATLLVAQMSFSQITISDATLPASHTIDGTSLTLNGGGLREKFWLDLYVGGLYLQAKTTDAEKVMNADEPMNIKLHIISSLITSEKMIDAVHEGFEKSTGGNTEEFSSKIDLFIHVFEQSPIKIGDIYDIAYTPAKGVQIFKNGSLKETIPGLDFKKVLYGIWFCNEPADEDLMEGMLGK